MVKANALSVETVDSKVLNLAKQDIIWHSVKELLTEEEQNPILGLNIVEYAGNNQAKIDSQVTALCQQLDEKLHKAKIILSAINFVLTCLLLNVFTPCVKKRWGYWGMRKALPNRFLLWKIPVCHQNILRITLQSLEPY